MPFLLPTFLCLNVLSLAAGSMLPTLRFSELSKQTDGCFPRFRKFPEQYNSCRHEHCFLFISQTLFVTLPQSMKSEEDQRLFACNGHHIAHPGLKGISFDILQETIAYNSSCAWIGNNCTFNQMVWFMAEQATSGYRFSTLTTMLETPARRKVSQWSTPFYEGRVIVIGSRESATNLSPIQQLLQPFRASAWGVALTFIAVFVILSLGIECRLNSNGCGVTDIMFLFVGEDSKKSVTRTFRQVFTMPKRFEQKSNSRATSPSDSNLNICDEDDLTGNVNLGRLRGYRMARILFRLSLFAFTTICIIFYEAGVVNFLFQKATTSLTKNLGSQSEEELRRFGVEIDQAVEDVFRTLVDSGNRFPPDKVPWYRCTKINKCWEKLLDPKDPLQYIIMFTAEAEYMVQYYQARSKVASFEPKEDLYTLTTGFLHNNAVPLNRVRDIDIDLLKLRQSKMFKRRIAEVVGQSLDSRVEPSNDIGWEILAIPLSIFVLPLIILVLFLLKSPGTQSSEEQGNV